FGLGMALVVWLRPLFFGWLDLRVDARFLSEPLFLYLLAGVLLLSVALAGSYPALLLSRFSPVEVFKGRFSKSGGAGVRRVLTVFQFVVSVGLIGCSLVVYRQLTFLKTQNAGLDKAGVVVLPVPPTLARHYAAFKAELRQEPGIGRVSAASWPLFKSGVSAFFTQTPKTKKEVLLWVTNVDDSFFETLGVPWKIRPRSAQGSRPNNTLVLNESALPELDLSGNPIGEKVALGIESYEIEGVIQDFNLFSLRQKTHGLAISVVPDTTSGILTSGGCFYIKLAPGTDVPRQLARVEALFKRYEAEYPFEYYFLDEAYDALYKSEARLGAMFAVFTGVALLIACLGLFGLATFAVETRTKEIGIRKVLGASVASVVTLLSGGFVKLILISVVIASPLVWWAMHRWLQDFATRIDLGWWVFALAGGLALVVALLTVGVQAVKAALANPVDSLRSE
ncbi:MAG: ABC transporter permease, partial [Sphingobacteriaceae bacterium]|nr:ABC transporter permease [Cytophagaceae bacterium]